MDAKCNSICNRARCSFGWGPVVRLLTSAPTRIRFDSHKRSRSSVPGRQDCAQSIIGLTGIGHFPFAFRLIESPNRDARLRM